MLTSLATRQVTSAGLGRAKNFTIKNNGKAFKVLIDGMYSDKIGAVIRELWTNAFDAHVAARCPKKKFECQLPTVFEPTFRVRDFGTSLAHYDVMNLYATVFESTKDGTNSQVGKLGLGSKSPFAYVDTFTVSSWCRQRSVLPRARLSRLPGKTRPAAWEAIPSDFIEVSESLPMEQRIYTAYIGEDYIPKIVLMSRGPTDEPRGFEVAFPCQARDVDTFANKAQRAAYGFETPPKFVGRQVTLIDMPVKMEDKGLWKLVDVDEDVFADGRAYARQGCVIYPIDATAIPDITPMQSAILRSPFFIDFAIGDLEIAASREGLGYDAPTCRNILVAVNLIAAEVRKRHEDEIAAAPTFWEASLRYEKLLNSGMHHALREALTTGMKWRGRTLHKQINLQTAMLHPAVKGKVAAMHHTGHYSRRRRTLKWEPTSFVSFTPSETMVYLEDNTRPISVAAARVRHHFEQKHPSHFVWFKCDPKSYAWKRVYAAMGRPEVTIVNDLDKPPVEKGYYRRPVQMRKLEGREFERTDVHEDDDIVYVNLDRGDVIGPRPFSSPDGRSLSDIVEQMIELGVLPAGQEIIGVPRSLKNVPVRNTHWRCLWDILHKAVDDNFEPSRIAEGEACSLAHDERHFGLAERILRNGFPATLAPQSALGRYLRVYERLRDRARSLRTHQKWLVLARWSRGREQVDNLVKGNGFISTEAFNDKVRAQYPMLRHEPYHVNDEYITSLLDYVKLIDSR